MSMQIPDTPVSMIAGTRSHGQARSLTSLWEPLASALKPLDAAGQDVIVDAGRLGLAGAPEPLVYGADLCLLVTRTDLVALSAARSWADTLRGGFEQQGAGSAVALLTVGEGRPYRAREVAKVLRCRSWRRWPGTTRQLRCSPTARPARAGSSVARCCGHLHGAGDAARASIGRADAQDHRSRTRVGGRHGRAAGCGGQGGRHEHRRLHTAGAPDPADLPLFAPVPTPRPGGCAAPSR